MNIRKIAYLAKDRLKNSAFRSNIADLTSQFNHRFPAQTSRVESITQYAIENTPYYSSYNDYDDFSEFPVLDKSTIKKNYDDFISEPYKSKLDNLHKVTTSGSYGTPFTFYLNPEKRQKMISEVYYFGRKSNFDLGVKHAYIMSFTKSKFLQVIQNQVMITVKEIEDKWCIETLKRLQKEKVKVLIGYPSAIARLAIYASDNNLSLPMKGIITISEVLNDDMRAHIKKGFNCSPISRYSTEEFGVLANQDISGEFFWLNQCNYLIEILSLDSNQPVREDELGRIVVTDLFNQSMPLIRYDTGDLAKPFEIINGRITKIESVEGRRLAVIRNTKAETISSFLINRSLRQFKNIIQFQFSQEGISLYKVKLVITDPVDEAEVIGIYQDILGSNAEIEIEYVDDIPPQRSGKRPYVLQNYEPYAN